MTKKVKEVETVEAEFQEIEGAEVEAQEEVEVPLCELRIGRNAQGGLYFTIAGSDQNLVLIDGLLKYGQREIDNLWASVTASQGE